MTVQSSSADLGDRLRTAREHAGLTQAEASNAVNIARTTLVAIEHGQRKVRINEIQEFAALYRISANSLLRQEAVHVDLGPRFRKLTHDEDIAVEQATQLMSDLVKAEVELENLLGVKRTRNYPQERPLLPGDVVAQAEQNANELRQWLGLGPGPISDIVTLLELQLGVRVYVRKLNGKVSGLFAFDDSVGACILLNANHPRERRTQSCAHELGHFVSVRQEPDVFQDVSAENSREERYANAFARAFLTPARQVMQVFREITAGAERLTRRHVIVAAHAFGVSREAMVRRLEELSLTKPGTWDWFQSNGGITDEHVRAVLGDLAPEDPHRIEADRPTSLRLSLLAGEAWRKGLLSEGQLARLLRLDRVEVREIIDGLEVGDGETDAAPRLPV